MATLPTERQDLIRTTSAIRAVPVMGAVTVRDNKIAR
jgi:limonene-1,2-epoxide hydrolase